MKKFYITTAIPYVNSKPHIGHVLEFVQTDVIRRYHDVKGFKTFLSSGSDENSIKNVKSAKSEGITIEELCEKYSERFKNLMENLGLSLDSFIRSSSNKHIKSSQKLWNLCKNDIYKKKYKGLYCEGCEMFFTKEDLVDDKCPEHMTEPKFVEEENYFFKLSKYQEKMKELIENNIIKIYPESKKNEILSFINSGLEDFSISRSKERAENWGVPVPNDDTQIMYVWFDALNIYQTAIGFGDSELYSDLWPCDMHVIGKGITRFHAIYWPAILLSAGLEIPKSIFIHGYVTLNGQKMSKSMGNPINPENIIKKYGKDQVRYYMIRDISPFNDGDFSEKRLVERVNEELVSNYSNLFYRVTSFIEKNFDSKIPEGEDELDEIIKNKELEYDKKMSELRLNEALEVAISLSGEGNEYFQRKAPWVSVKNDVKDCSNTMYNSCKLLASVSKLLYPFIPDSSDKAMESLGTKVSPIMLFKNLEYKIEDSIDVLSKVNDMLPLKEFEKVDLRVGTVEDIEDHPDADKLYVLKIDLGNEKRQIVSGLKELYSKEELKGMQIIVIANLEPAEIRGVKSEGMLLAAGKEASILTPLKNVKNGEKIK